MPVGIRVVAAAAAVPAGARAQGPGGLVVRGARHLRPGPGSCLV